MSKRAEERAMEAYPVEIVGFTTECRVGATPKPQDWNEDKRKCYQEGYEQAEKDTIEKVKMWILRQRGIGRAAWMGFEKFMEEDND